MDNIVSIISNVGFPIAACVFLAFYCKNMIDDNRTQITAMQDSHKQEIAELRTAIENNTLVMQKVIDKLGIEK